MISSTQLILPSDGNFNVILITDQVADFIHSSGLRDGLVTVFFQHTTGCVFINEHEAGILADVEDALERFAPRESAYLHHLRGVDTNGHAHVHAAVMPTSVTVPVVQGRMALGTHQEILVLDEQVEKEPRYVLVQVMGETA